MTFEELKTEAKKQGYKLVKAKPSVKFLPCICGGKRREWWSRMNINFKEERSVVCLKCGLRSPWIVGSDNALKTAWNNMIIRFETKN
nr:MAG TPA: hypothetical protein [Caudoviricetes sp.]